VGPSPSPTHESYAGRPPDFPLGVELDVFVGREGAEHFIEEVRGDDSEMAAKLRIEERELERAGFV
jgi:hypothetical protein